MGDDDELGVLRHLAHIAGKADDVGVVQCGLDLVHDHEGGGADLQDGKVEGNGHKGLLPAGEKGDDLQTLSGGLDLDLNAAVENILRVLQLQVGLAAAKELHKGPLKRLVDLGELIGKDTLHLPRHIGNDLQKLGLGLAHIVPLAGEVSIPLVDPLELIDGVQVDIAQGGDGALQLPHPSLGPGDALQLQALGPGGLVSQLIGLPQPVQDLPLLHLGGGLLLLQHRDLPLHGEQLVVLVPAPLVGLCPLSLQIQPLLVEPLNVPLLGGGLGLDGLELLLILLDLGLQLLVLGLQFTDTAGAVLPVSHHVPAQVLQFPKGLAGRQGLSLQSRLLGVEGGDLAVHGLALLPCLILALDLALRLGPEGGGRPLQLLDPLPGALGILLGPLSPLSKLLQLPLPLIPLAADILHALVQVAHPLLQLQDVILMLALLGLGRVHLILGACDLPLGLLQRLGSGGKLFTQARLLLPQPLQLSLAAEDARRTGGRTARHSAAGIQHLTVQRHDLQFMLIFPCHGNGGVHILGDHRPAQQIGKDLLILFLALNELVAQPHKAGLVHYVGLLELSGLNGLEGQEGAAPPVPTLQILDGALAILLPLHHHVLHGGAQGGLDGHGVFSRDPQKPRHRPQDPFELAPLRLPHHHLHRFGIPLIELFHFSKHVDAGLQGAELHLKLHMLLISLLKLFGPAGQPQGIAADDIFNGVPVLPGLSQFLFGLLGLGLGGGKPLLTLGELLADCGVPVQHLLGGGGKGGEKGLGLGGGGGLHRLLLPQGLHLGGKAARVSAQLIGLGLLPGDLFLQSGDLPLDLIQTTLALGDLSLNGTGPPLLGLQLPLEAVSVFNVVLDVGLQDLDGLLPLVGVGLAAHHLKADTLGVHLLLAHLLTNGLGGGVEPLHLRLDLPLLANGVFIVGLDLDASGADPVQLLHPKGDLQAPQLIPKDQKFLGLLRRDPQGLHLELQLIDLVVDPRQVLLGPLQLPLGLLLPVAKTGDARRLLKDLPAVGGLDGQDLVDLSLADDGVTLPAQARVHKQLIHIPQPYRPAVDVVFALP